MGQQHSSRQNLQDTECSGCSGGRSPSSGDALSSSEGLDDCSVCPHCSDRSSEEHEERPSSEASGNLGERQCYHSAKEDSLKQDLSNLAITQRCCCSTGDLCKKTSSVDRYVSALVSRGCWRGAPSSGSSADRRRRRRGGWTARFGTSESPQRSLARDSSGRRCVCTAYRRVEEDDLTNGNGAVCRWTATAVLAVGESPHSHSADDADVILVSLPSSSGAPLLDLSRLEQRLSGGEGSESPAASASSDHIRQHETNERSLNYKRAHFQVVCGADLRALILSAAAPMPPPIPPPPTSEPLPSMTPMASMMPPPPYAVPLPTKIHTQVDYIHCLVPDLRAIIACAFYWGKMDRYEAERLLDGRPEGTFLLRDSAQEDHLFSVSFRKYGRSLHARIEHFNHRFSFDSHDPGVYSARTVTGLIEHYKDPACVMFFEPMLTWPLARANPFSLQQLARATIASSTTYDGISELPLPTSLQAYLKEYHYRQRVRVTRFDNPN